MEALLFLIDICFMALLMKNLAKAEKSKDPEQLGLFRFVDKREK